MTGIESGSLTSISSDVLPVAYGAATIGAFALLTMVRDPSGEASRLNSWSVWAVGRHLRRRSSRSSCELAGIPLTSGFIGKWAVFAAAWSGGFEGLLSSRW